MLLRSYNLSMKKIILTYDRLYCEAPVFHVYLCTRQNLFCVCSSREIETDGLGTLKKKTVQEITVIKNTVNSLPLRKKTFFWRLHLPILQTLQNTLHISFALSEYTRSVISYRGRNIWKLIPQGRAGEPANFLAAPAPEFFLSGSGSPALPRGNYFWFN